jgi:methionine--tRNA ligase beta chain
MITYEDFKKLELRIARIKEAREHPNADRLYVLVIELEDGRTKQIVAGIRASYTKEELVGKEVVVVDNLAPAMLRGEESQGMLLAASDESGISILMPHREVKLGSVVK